MRARSFWPAIGADMAPVRRRPDAGLRARRRARRFGLRSEWLAAALLAVKGYRILARHFVIAGGEIDLIARRGDTIVFVEVKARDNRDEALLAIGALKKQRIARAARVWLARNPAAMQANLRGDAVLIAPRRLPRHIIGAFDLEIA
jgi:putative endonuclease